MRSLTLQKSLTIVSVLFFSSCESNDPQINLCFFVNHIDGKPVDSPYFGCADPKGNYYEIDSTDIKANLYRAVSPEDFEKLRKYCGGKPDKNSSE